MYFIDKNTFEYPVSKCLYIYIFFILNFKGIVECLLWPLYHLLLGDLEG